MNEHINYLNIRFVQILEEDTNIGSDGQFIILINFKFDNFNKFVFSKIVDFIFTTMCLLTHFCVDFRFKNTISVEYEINN